MKTAGWEYYAREVADGLEDYYAGVGEAPGVWTGVGASVAGLSGTETGDALALAFGDARHPVSGERLGGGWRAEGVIGFDATFSAPKSVSLSRSCSRESACSSRSRAHKNMMRRAQCGSSGVGARHPI
jgi:hypothetical protein